MGNALERLKKYMRIKTTDIAMEDHKIWLSLSEGNGLAEIGMDTWKPRLLCKFDEADSSNLYNSISKIGNKIILIPDAAEKIAVYDIPAGHLQCINLEHPDGQHKEVYNPGAKFCAHFVDGEIIYILGNHYPAIVRINVQTLEVSYLLDWIPGIEKYIAQGDCKGYIGMGYVKSGRKVYFPFQCYSAVLELDLDTLLTEVKLINSSLDGIATMVQDGETIWLQGKGDTLGKIVRVNRQWELLNEIDSMEPFAKAAMIDYRVLFWKPILTEKKILLFPSIASAIYEIDRNTFEIKKSRLNALLKQEEAVNTITISFAKRIGDKIYFLTTHNKKLHIYDAVTEELESRFICLSQEYIESEMRNKIAASMKYGGALYEKEIELHYFLREVKHRGSVMACKNVGEEIYKMLRAGL